MNLSTENIEQLKKDLENYGTRALTYHYENRIALIIDLCDEILTLRREVERQQQEIEALESVVKHLEENDDGN